jgi:hypothetical protein
MPLVPSQALVATGASFIAALVVCAFAIRTFEKGQPLFDA